MKVKVKQIDRVFDAQTGTRAALLHMEDGSTRPASHAEAQQAETLGYVEVGGDQPALALEPNGPVEGPGPNDMTVADLKSSESPAPETGVEVMSEPETDPFKVIGAALQK